MGRTGRTWRIHPRAGNIKKEKEREKSKQRWWGRVWTSWTQRFACVNYSFHVNAFKEGYAWTANICNTLLLKTFPWRKPTWVYALFVRSPRGYCRAPGSLLESNMLVFLEQNVGRVTKRRIKTKWPHVSWGQILLSNESYKHKLALSNFWDFWIHSLWVCFIQSRE